MKHFAPDVLAYARAGYPMAFRVDRAAIVQRLEETIDRYMALLDQMDGDPDLEDEGNDELAGDHGDVSWPEWHERGFFKLQGNGYEFLLNGGGSDDDEACGDETDGSFAEDESAAVFLEMMEGPGCLVADPDVEIEWRGEPEWPCLPIVAGHRMAMQSGSAT